MPKMISKKKCNIYRRVTFCCNITKYLKLPCYLFNTFVFLFQFTLFQKNNMYICIYLLFFGLRTSRKDTYCAFSMEMLVFVAYKLKSRFMTIYIDDLLKCIMFDFYKQPLTAIPEFPNSLRVVRIHRSFLIKWALTKKGNLLC